MRKKIRVVQFGVGPIGASIARLLRQKKSLEIVGGIDRDPAKAGRDLGEIVGAPDAPWGVPVSARPPAVLDRPVDVVMHTTSSSLPAVMDELLACIHAGCCVVSTCEELAYPFRKHPELSANLDLAAKEEGVALVGTGVNPGFVMDKLVLVLSAVAQRVDFAKAVRIVDASKRRLPLQKKIGAGITEAEFHEQVAAGIIKHHGLPESVAMVADGLGLVVDDISETIEPVIAEETVKTPFLEVAPGQVAGVHQIARGASKGEEKIFMELQMYVGAKHPGDTVELRGEPNLSLTIPGGAHGDIATAAIAVNAIPAILAAPAGLRTVRDLPLAFFPPLPLS
ncbi:MAG: dihydrodipicolinate reductase [Candidatus Acidiferrales bacterium]